MTSTSSSTGTSWPASKIGSTSGHASPSEGATPAMERKETRSSGDRSMETGRDPPPTVAESSISWVTVRRTSTASVV